MPLPTLLLHDTLGSVGMRAASRLSGFAVWLKADDVEVELLTLEGAKHDATAAKTPSAPSKPPSNFSTSI